MCSMILSYSSISSRFDLPQNLLTRSWGLQWTRRHWPPLSTRSTGNIIEYVVFLIQVNIIWQTYYLVSLLTAAAVATRVPTWAAWSALTATGEGPAQPSISSGKTMKVTSWIWQILMLFQNIIDVGLNLINLQGCAKEWAPGCENYSGRLK